ncbi:unnamed protein product, partial [Darwinula stevensoni]
NCRRIGGGFHPGEEFNAKHVAVTSDGRLLFLAAFWDGSIRVFNVLKGKLIQTLHRHQDVVTCLELDSVTNFVLMTGSRDGTSMLWEVVTGVGGAPVGLDPKPMHTLYGHDAPITHVSLAIELDIAISGSLDGTVNVYGVKEGLLLHTLHPPAHATVSGLHVLYLALSYMGHIAVYSEAKGSGEYRLDVYSVNGKHLCSYRPPSPLSCLLTAQDFLLVADIHGNLSFRHIFGLSLVSTLPLHQGVRSLAFAPGCTHLLAPLTDGSVAIIHATFPEFV